MVAGRGKVQTLTMQGFEETPLEPGAFVWFTPGTIHRLVNDGDLEILVLMANAGLPEAGDMVITFEPDVVADAERYTEAATLPDDDRTTSGPGDAARLRRDRRSPSSSAWPRRSPPATRPSCSSSTTQPLPSSARGCATGSRSGGSARWPRSKSGAQLTALATGDAAHLADAMVARSLRRPTSGAWAAAAPSAPTSPCRQTRRRRSATLPGDPGGGHEPVTHPSYNVENLFDRAKALNWQNPGTGRRSSGPRRAVAAPRARPVHGGRQEEDSSCWRSSGSCAATRAPMCCCARSAAAC